MKRRKEKKQLTKREIQVLSLVAKNFHGGSRSEIRNTRKTFFAQKTNLLTETDSKVIVGLLRYEICAGLFQDPILKAK